MTSCIGVDIINWTDVSSFNSKSQFSITISNLELIDGIEVLDLKDSFKGVSILILANNHESYRDWDISEALKEMKRPSVIYDAWRMLDKNVVKEHKDVLYMSPGL